MKACRVLLFVLFCVCAVDTAEVQFRLSELELSMIGHHDDHDTECNLKIGHQHDHDTGKLDHPTEKLVLVVYTGGTIGMVINIHGVLVPKPHALLNYLRNLTMFHDEKYALETHLYDRYKHPQQICVLPLNKLKQRIVYRILEYSPLLDSSNMSEKDWIKIVKTIEENYETHDGFVILHGTDTMAFTSSALSFMCENLAKPVIVTGSQIPIYEMRTDGRDNLMGALLIAGTAARYVIPEVCLYFYDKLYRGNRVTKVDAESFRAFNSPNLSPLADVGVDITVNWDIVRKVKLVNTAVFNVSTELNQNVGLLRIFPGINAATVRAFLQPPMEGVVLETFGAGNAPDKNKDLMKELKKATARGIIIINITQCLRGTVIMTLYATGKALVDAGVISGGDMTQEAALSKLSYVLAKSNLDLKAKKEMMENDLRGERGDLDGDKTYPSDSRFVRYKESDK